MSRQPPTDASPSFNPTEASARSVGALAPLAPGPRLRHRRLSRSAKPAHVGHVFSPPPAVVKRLPRDAMLRPAGWRYAPEQADGPGRTRGPSGAVVVAKDDMDGMLRPVALRAQTGTVMELSKGLGLVLLGFLLLLSFLGERKVASLLCARRVRSPVTDTEVRGEAHRKSPNQLGSQPKVSEETGWEIGGGGLPPHTSHSFVEIHGSLEQDGLPFSQRRPIIQRSRRRGNQRGP